MRCTLAPLPSKPLFNRRQNTFRFMQGILPSPSAHGLGFSNFVGKKLGLISDSYRLNILEGENVCGDQYCALLGKMCIVYEQDMCRDMYDIQDRTYGAPLKLGLEEVVYSREKA